MYESKLRLFNFCKHVYLHTNFSPLEFISFSKKHKYKKDATTKKTP